MYLFSLSLSLRGPGAPLRRRIPKAESHPCMVGWQPATRLSTGPPSCCYLWLLPWHKCQGVRQPVSLPGGCLHERWRFEPNQPFLFSDDAWQAGAPFPMAVWPCTPNKSARIPHPAIPPMTGPPTSQTTLAGPPSSLQVPPHHSGQAVGPEEKGEPDGPYEVGFS